MADALFACLALSGVALPLLAVRRVLDLGRYGSVRDGDGGAVLSSATGVAAGGSGTAAGEALDVACGSVVVLCAPDASVGTGSVWSRWSDAAEARLVCGTADAAAAVTAPGHGGGASPGRGAGADRADAGTAGAFGAPGAEDVLDTGLPGSGGVACVSEPARTAVARTGTAVGWGAESGIAAPGMAVASGVSDPPVSLSLIGLESIALSVAERGVVAAAASVGAFGAAGTCGDAPNGAAAGPIADPAASAPVDVGAVAAAGGAEGASNAASVCPSCPLKDTAAAGGVAPAVPKRGGAARRALGKAG